MARTSESLAEPPGSSVELQSFSVAGSQVALDHADQGSQHGIGRVIEHDGYGDLVARKCPLAFLPWGESLVHQMTKNLLTCVIFLELAIFFLLHLSSDVQAFETGLVPVVLISITYAFRGWFTIYIPVADTPNKKVFWALLILFLQLLHLIGLIENPMCNYLQLCEKHGRSVARSYLREDAARYYGWHPTEYDAEVQASWFMLKLHMNMFLDWVFAIVAVVALMRGNAPNFVGDYSMRMVMLAWGVGNLSSLRLRATACWFEGGSPILERLEAHIDGFSWAFDRLVVTLHLMLVRRRVKYLEAVTYRCRSAATLLLVFGGVQLICFTPMRFGSLELASTHRHLLFAFCLRMSGAVCLMLFAVVVRQSYKIVLCQIHQGRIRLAQDSVVDPVAYLLREKLLTLFAIYGVVVYFLGMCTYYVMCWHGLRSRLDKEIVRDMMYDISRVGVVMHCLLLRWPQAIVAQ